jgi:predicted Abi (CAAX) family protease
MINPDSLFHILLHRLCTAFTTIPNRDQWALAGILLLFALVAMPAGFATGFLRIETIRSGRTLASILLASLLFPALAEETLFRVALLPHPSERASLGTRVFTGIMSLCLFVGSHPLKVWRARSVRGSTFRDPTFLLTAALLGLVCTLAYIGSGSVWPPVLIHWAAVFTWLCFLGGRRLVSKRVEV